MLKRVLVVVTVCLALAVLAVPVQAQSAIPVSGLWWYLPTVESSRTVGDNTILSTTEVAVWEGDFVGESTEVGRVIQHASGMVTFQGWVTFSSLTVDGKTGTARMRVSGVKESPSADWEGHWVIIAAEGDLEGLHGNGTFSGPGWSPPLGNNMGYVTYDGTVHFRPCRKGRGW